jgi:hypothetical protein
MPGAGAIHSIIGATWLILVDEDQPVGIGIALSIEPVQPPFQDVGAILLDGVAGPFFRVMAWRRKKRQRDEVEAATPRSNRCLQSSASVMSGVSASAAWITSACASILRDRMSPPWGFGAKDPVVRRASSQRIAVDGATPYRAAAARRPRPASIAAITRSLSSMESGLPIAVPIICLGVSESLLQRNGNPQSIQIGG